VCARSDSVCVVEFYAYILFCLLIYMQKVASSDITWNVGKCLKLLTCVCRSKLELCELMIMLFG